MNWGELQLLTSLIYYNDMMKIVTIISCDLYSSLKFYMFQHGVYQVDEMVLNSFSQSETSRILVARIDHSLN